MKSLTAFSWGYWGWGNHTQEFVRMVDAVERARGKRPPIFVDIRFYRSVRALGFRGAAFEEILGKNRYRWLRKLGNARIGSGRGGLQIADPSGVDDLLQLVLDAERDRRRIIFFCACERPGKCHRVEAARLLIKAARKKKIALTVVEWPGGEPELVEFSVSEKVIKRILHEGNRVPIASSGPDRLRKLAALPWCSRVALRSDASRIAVIAGPAQLAAGGWYLPVIGPDVSKLTDTVESIGKDAKKLRRACGYRPVSVMKV